MTEYKCPYCSQWIEEKDLVQHMIFAHDVVEKDVKSLLDRFRHVNQMEVRQRKE